VLEPLTRADAKEMVHVLGDERLYEFTGGHPPAVAELRERYARWESRRSPDGSEEWLNWTVRRVDDRAAVGTVQATVTEGGRRAEVAWLIGAEWQGRSYASEAARALVDWLELRGVSVITAHIHPGHRASQAVARHAGLVATDALEDGEVVWQRSSLQR